MARRKITFAKLWSQHESLYRHIFVEALVRLAAELRILGDENDVSKHLATILVAVCQKNAKARNEEIRTPLYELPQQPVNIDETQEDFIRKKPDFTCNRINLQAKSLPEYEIPFHVECKLLGKPTSSTWILNRNYVTNGIARFDLQSHKYGNWASSGLMIGYIVSMTPGEIQTQVNSHIEKKLPGVPRLEFKLSGVPLRSKHRFERKHVTPTPFTLFHLWVDLRSNYRGK